MKQIVSLGPINTADDVKQALGRLTAAINSLGSVVGLDGQLDDLKAQVAQLSTAIAKSTTRKALYPGEHLTGGAYNGDSAVRWEIESAADATPDSLVARDHAGHSEFKSVRVLDITRTKFVHDDDDNQLLKHRQPAVADAVPTPAGPGGWSDSGSPGDPATLGDVDGAGELAADAMAMATAAMTTATDAMNKINDILQLVLREHGLIET